jgi:hypothetical protein
LERIPATDAGGNKVPDWKRQMMAKKLAEQAHKEYLEQKKVSVFISVNRHQRMDK